MTTAQMTHGSDGKMLMVPDCDMRDHSTDKIDGISESVIDKEIVQKISVTTIGRMISASHDGGRVLSNFLAHRCGIPLHRKFAVAKGNFSATLKIYNIRVRGVHGAIYIDNTRYRNMQRAFDALNKAISRGSHE
jgi:hypothetical protein